MRILENNLFSLEGVMKSLADETRLRILNLLLERDCCVCEVMQALSISQTRASRNLTQLHDAGLLEQRKEGLWTIYYLSPAVSADFRVLIVEGVDRALAGDAVAAADRTRLRSSPRLCPPAPEPGTATGPSAAEHRCLGL
jgi:ArsR family transcriptional regulator